MQLLPRQSFGPKDYVLGGYLLASSAPAIPMRHCHTGVLCRCVYQHPDKAGKIGVELNRDLVKVAGRALTHNLTKLGPKVLPWSEKLLYAANWVVRKTVGCKEYVPDFKQAFDHFCLHAGETGALTHLTVSWLAVHTTLSMCMD